MVDDVGEVSGVGVGELGGEVSPSTMLPRLRHLFSYHLTYQTRGHRSLHMLMREREMDRGRYRDRKRERDRKSTRLNSSH